MKKKDVIIIGITGKTGSGKSTIGKYIAEHYNGFYMDCDKLGHSILERIEIIERLKDSFGAEVIEVKEDGSLNVHRASLGNIVFQDANKLEQLNAIMHPEIKKEVIRNIEKEMEKENDFIIIDGAVLIESNIIELCDVSLCIKATEEIRLQRLVTKRNVPKEKAVSIIKAQKERVYPFDYIIDSSKGITSLEQEIEDILHESKKKK